jgi:hypothetical protein
MLVDRLAGYHVINGQDVTAAKITSGPVVRPPVLGRALACCLLGRAHLGSPRPAGVPSALLGRPRTPPLWSPAACC